MSRENMFEAKEREEWVTSEIEEGLKQVAKGGEIACSQAMEFARGEIVEWFIEDKETLVLHRPEAPQRKLKKTPANPSSEKSRGSSVSVVRPSGKRGTGSEENDSS